MIIDALDIEVFSEYDDGEEDQLDFSWELVTFGETSM